MKEEWKPVKGSDGWYEVNNQGEVRSWISGNKHKRTRSKKPRLLKAAIGPNGRPQVSVIYNFKRRIKRIHLLVAESFLGLRPDKMMCCHKNGNNQDNRADNLYWGTQKENMADARRHGTLTVGSKNARAVIDEAMAMKIKTAIKNGMRNCNIARNLNVTLSIVEKIKDGTRWKHVQC